MPTVAAFAIAGKTPADDDVSEVHHSFTAVDVIGYEDLGFAARPGADTHGEAEVTTITRCVQLSRRLRGEIVEGPGSHGG